MHDKLITIPCALSPTDPIHFLATGTEMRYMAVHQRLLQGSYYLTLEWIAFPIRHYHTVHIGAHQITVVFSTMEHSFGWPVIVPIQSPLLLPPLPGPLPCLEAKPTSRVLGRILLRLRTSSSHSVKGRHPS